nr:PadR family transcriptional regulator [Cellulomonas sp. APG4]
MLALLAEQPMHGYQLKQEFERRTGGTWPLNIGQVYTTVQRLVRDGLVVPVPQGETGPAEDVPVERFRLTPDGEAEAAGWWSRPVERGAPARDELAIKLALAVTVPGVDVAAMIQAQRTETLRSLRDYTRLKASAARAGAAEGADLAWSLVLDNLVFAAEAEVRWLDHVEARVARAARAGGLRAKASTDATGASTPSEGATGPRATGDASTHHSTAAPSGRRGAP